ncbi:MAG: putative monocarboxylate transporter mch1 [Trizodia sp. TS-e1964]|nr:MAG: putative monocarboxylate transporter mch1 [Trizodia sp. TS-e1964]
MASSTEANDAIKFIQTNDITISDPKADPRYDFSDTLSSLLRHDSQDESLLLIPGSPYSTEDDFHPGEVSIKYKRQKKQSRAAYTRYASFACAILSCLCAGSITAYSLYGHLFLTRLNYSQFQVNIISITAELAMYLPVPLFGYLCDRYNPRPVSLLSGILFGLGYLIAALAYHLTGPFQAMALAFVFIGMGTSCMYVSAVTTCAKNFGRGKHKGFALAVPIAAFGLSGMWQSQVGSRILYERETGEVDVFKYFIFLSITLLLAGIIGTFGLRIVDESEMIDDALERLEQSGLLEESAFFHAGSHGNGYGTIDAAADQADDQVTLHSHIEEKKVWLLNEATRMFLLDKTLWWLAAGFFLVTGPGEAFINNMGTIIGTLSPPPQAGSPTNSPTTAATHVSIVAITSTISRIFTGTLSDMLAPRPPSQKSGSTTSSLFSVSRISFLLAFALLLSMGQVLLASGLIQGHGERFWLVSALIGAGYGATFSLAPIIVSVVWGVENFGTNWGILAMTPALGATVWGLAYSAVYQKFAGRSLANSDVTKVDIQLESDGALVGYVKDELCYGRECYASTFWAMTISVWLACGLWVWAWRGPGGWKRRGIAL